MNPLLQEATRPAPASSAAEVEGLVPRLLTRWLFREASVVRNDLVMAGLHRIELSGTALRGEQWTTGDKLQIRMGSGLQTRTSIKPQPFSPCSAAWASTPRCWHTGRENAASNAWFEAALAQGPDRRSEVVGRARTIQLVRGALREHGVASGRILATAYWADGKAGLD